MGAEVTFGKSGPSIAVLASPCVDRRDGCWLRLWRHHGSTARRASQPVPADRPVRDCPGPVDWRSRGVSGAAPDEAPPALFRLLNQRKYPASALFLLMTLGPTIALLAVAERARLVRRHSGDVRACTLCSTTCCTSPSSTRPRSSSGWREMAACTRTGSGPPRSCRFLPASGGGCHCSTWVFLFVIAVLYIPCRWFAGIKARGQRGWLRYL